jgi:hypothetical protein
MNYKPYSGWLSRLTTRVVNLETYADAIDAAATVVDSGTTTPTAITAAQALAGLTVTNLGATGEVKFTLPAAVVGMKVRAIVKVAQLLTFAPATDEVIHLTTGVAQAGNAELKANVVGENIALECFVTGKWVPTSYIGTWTATGA